jgi:hypothetical protein
VHWDRRARNAEVTQETIKNFFRYGRLAGVVAAQINVQLAVGKTIAHAVGPMQCEPARSVAHEASPSFLASHRSPLWHTNHAIRFAVPQVHDVHG